MHSDRRTKVSKKVINLDRQAHVMCAWDECEKDGVELHKTRVNYGANGSAPRIVSYVFCSEGHKQYWINSHRSYGNLPSGSKRSF